VRREFNQLPSRVDALKKWGLNPSKQTVLVFGGSLGAHRLNQFVVDAFAADESQLSKLQVIHITGPSDFMWVKEQYGKTKIEHYVDSYCHDMPSAYAATDLVICRAGASTISELMVVKKPAILVPYPFATADHQTANATTLEELGAAKIFQERNLSGKELIPLLNDFIQNPKTWQNMSECYKNLTIDPVQAAGMIAALVRKNE
jgi:UDP-N-acetylglucosamine--N-acetylmuramyl-(pentapeptide) pyrophosphoryl-undecaprenol N-acetylglucosamine transferase